MYNEKITAFAGNYVYKVLRVRSRARAHTRIQIQNFGPPRATAVIISLSRSRANLPSLPPCSSSSLLLRLILRLNRADRTRVVRFLVLVTDNY